MLNKIQPTNTAFFSDLDGTLLYSKNTMNIKFQPQPYYQSMVVAEIFQHSPLTFITFEAMILLSELSNKILFIPTTTRTNKQYERINIPHVKHDYAITTNGAKILHHGLENEDWNKHIQENVISQSLPIDEVYSLIIPHLKNKNWFKSYKQIENLFGYLIIDKHTVPDDFITFLKYEANNWNYEISYQGRKIYLIPKKLDKGSAVTEIINTLHIDYSFGAGDSILDKSLLSVVDYPIRPSHGELHEEKYNMKNLKIISNSGIFAGEEIIRKVLHEVSL